MNCREGEVRCERIEALPDGRLISPSAERNKAPILAVLQRTLPETGLVLEIASGTGQHIVHFAGRLHRLIWQPSDPSAECRQSISTWLAASNLPNVRAALDLDVQLQPWPATALEAILCINLLHIAPWSAAIALFSGAARALRAGGLLFLYGPFFHKGTVTAPSNLKFDRELRAQNPAWGLRDLEELIRLGAEFGFDLAETVEMPANNLSVLFRKHRETDPGAPGDGS